MDFCVCKSLYWCSHGLMGSCWVVCICSRVDVRVCVGLYGKSEPTMVRGSIDRRLCASHVKFMFCAAVTKEPWNGFWGEIMPEQWEDGTEDNETDEK